MTFLSRAFTILFLVTAFTGHAYGQLTNQRVHGPNSSTSTSSNINLVKSGASFHRLIWYAQGTVDTCAVKLEKSADGSSWADLIADQDCTASGEATTTSIDVPNYVRINNGTLTGTDEQLTVVYQGYSSDPAGGGGGMGEFTGNITELAGNAIATNTGTVSAGTQRVTLATNVALPTGTNSIGQVTANAGTNLNTSALALESGGNLAAIAGAVAMGGTDLNVICTGGCAGGTTDTDDGTVAGAQSTGIQIGLPYMWNGSNWVRVLGNATDGLQVDLGTNNDVTVTGTVTANAGTNLNTSALSLEATQQDVLTELVNTVAELQDAVAQLTSIAADVGSDDPVVVQERGYSHCPFDAVTTNTDAAHECFTGAGTLVGYHCMNQNAATIFLQFYDAATATTINVGTTTHSWVDGVPANSTSDGGSNLFLPVALANGLKIAATTTKTGDTAPGTGMNCRFSYRQ